MKKFASLLLVLSVCMFSFAGCGGAASDTPAEDAAETAVEAADDAAEAAGEAAEDAAEAVEDAADEATE